MYLQLMRLLWHRVNLMIRKRASGILLHITSLPSRYGIGDFGPEAYKFVDFLAQAGQRYWQVLPLGPVASGGNYRYEGAFVWLK